MLEFNLAKQLPETPGSESPQKKLENPEMHSGSVGHQPGSTTSDGVEKE
jgi:hypothetical protein